MTGSKSLTPLTRYFTYASNLNTQQFRGRCPNSRYLRPAVLLNYEFIITRRGFASVLPCPRGRVEGYLCELTKEDEENLDACEGVGSGSCRKEYLPVKIGPKTITALVYVATDSTFGVPTEDYCRTIMKGVADRKLSERYQKKLFKILNNKSTIDTSLPPFDQVGELEQSAPPMFRHQPTTVNNAAISHHHYVIAAPEFL